MIANILEKRYKVSLILSVIYAVLLFFPALTDINVNYSANSQYYSYFDFLIGGFCSIKILLLVLCTISIFCLSGRLKNIFSQTNLDKLIILFIIAHFILNRFIWKAWEKAMYPTGDIFFSYIFYWLVDVLMFLIYVFGYVKDMRNNQISDTTKIIE